jgi:hypothetical protein
MRAEKQALEAGTKATSQCQQAKLASTDAQLQSIVQQSREASDDARDAADKVQRRYFKMRDTIANTSICNLPIESPSVSFNAEEASAMAEMATFGVELAVMAVKKASEVFTRLKESAMECKNLTAGEQSIAHAQALLKATQRAKRQATKKARLSRAQAQAAQVPAYTNKLRDSANMAGQFSNDALLAAEKARDNYFLLRDELKRPICGVIEQSVPDGSRTEQSPLVPDTSATASPTKFPTKSPTVSPTRSPTKSPTASPISSPIASPTAAEYEEADNIEVKGLVTVNGMDNESETPLKRWLVELTELMYGKILERLLKEHYAAETPTECNFEGFGVHISIITLETQSEVFQWFTLEDCEAF